MLSEHMDPDNRQYAIKTCGLNHFCALVSWIAIFKTHNEHWQTVGNQGGIKPIW